MARLGVDIGGTFTDLVLVHDDGRVAIAKTSTTPDDPSEAVVLGTLELLRAEAVSPQSVTLVVHGTTVGSNTILQKTGARTGLLTTPGFRDTLEIARIRTPGMFDLAWEKPEPLVPRRYRMEIKERIGADGSVITAFDPDSVRSACRRFADEGVEAVAICLINSYVNPAHEVAVKELLEREFPQFLATASCDVLPEIKEYERTSTTVVNAYLLPAMRTYLGRLAKKLAECDVTAPLLIMASNGGNLTVATASSKPVFAVASGPAGGVIGAARLGHASGHSDLIVFDMGGTTAKASIVDGGAPSVVSEYEFREGISTPSRFIKGGGYTLKVPAIDIAEVGAGGGSIASVDEAGLLRVGPESAGSAPGPACYGLGNERPTVTDANLHLGYLNPRGLAGGSLQISKAKADDAIAKWVAQPLKVDVTRAAHGIRDLVNASMARAIRSVTVERGRDPRDLVLMAFGGNGPVHAVDVARELSIRRVIVPARSGVFCALGMLTSDVEHPIVRPLLKSVATLDQEVMQRVLDELRAHGAERLRADGFGAEAMSFEFRADLRYAGQSSDLSVPADRATATPTALAAAFGTAYEQMFGYRTGEPVELVALRCLARGHQAGTYAFQPSYRQIATAGAPRETRKASFGAGQEFVSAPVYDWDAIGASPISGPAIVEAYDTTVIVPPGASICADSFSSLVIEIA